MNQSRQSLLGALKQTSALRILSIYDFEWLTLEAVAIARTEDNHIPPAERVVDRKVVVECMLPVMMLLATVSPPLRRAQWPGRSPPASSSWTVGMRRASRAVTPPLRGPGGLSPVSDCPSRIYHLEPEMAFSLTYM
jgi:hypothetical protein